MTNRIFPSYTNFNRDFTIGAIAAVLGIMFAIIIFQVHPAAAGQGLSSAASASTQSYTAASSIEVASIHRDTYSASSTKAKPAKHIKAHLPACKEEDSDNCIWNASREGNRYGESFIAWHGVVYYAEPDSNN